MKVLLRISVPFAVNLMASGGLRFCAIAVADRVIEASEA